jgi:hypothetical protein
MENIGKELITDEKVAGRYIRVMTVIIRIAIASLALLSVCSQVIAAKNSCRAVACV